MRKQSESNASYFTRLFQSTTWSSRTQKFQELIGINENKTDLSAGLVILEVHETPLVAVEFPRVEELPGEPHSVIDVRTASGPLPSGRSRFSRSRTRRTATGRDITSRTGLCHGVRHAGARYRVSEGRFSWSWK